MNADTLWQQSLIWELFHRPWSDNHFQFSTNLSLVPDLALGATLQLVAGSWRWAVYASLLVRFLVYGYAGGWLARSIAGISVPLAALYVEAISGALVLLTTLPPAWDEGHLLYPAAFPVATTYLPATHSGGFVVGLALATFIIWSLQRPLAWWRALLVYALTTAIVLSDREMLLAFVAPALAVTLGYAALRRTRAVIICAGVTAAAVAASAYTGAALLLPLFNHAPDLPLPTFAQFMQHLPPFCDALRAFAIAHPNQVAGLVLLAIAFVALPIVVSEEPATPQRERAWLAWWFCLLALGGATAFAIALYVDDDTYRYFEPVLFAYVPIAVALLVRIVRSPAVLPGFVALVALVAAVQLARSGSIAPGSLAWEPGLAACLNSAQSRYGLQAGLAGFWTSRPLTLASNSTLQVDQVQPDGTMQYYTNDDLWYSRSFADPRRPPAYRFIVMRELDDRAVTATYGGPDHIDTCGDTGIWIYNDPQHIAGIINARR